MNEHLKGGAYDFVSIAGDLWTINHHHFLSVVVAHWTSIDFKTILTLFLCSPLAKAGLSRSGGAVVKEYV